VDLHDYADVAENYDNYISIIDNTPDFLDFYLDCAKRYGQGAIIDIACGTGAVLLPLAEQGYDIDGTDLSEAMVEVSKRKAAEKGLHLNIFAADMTDFQAERKYALAIIARSGFMHLTSPALQRKALVNIRENLLPNGMLTLNTFAPDVHTQYRQVNTTPEDYSFRLEYTNRNGQRERIYNAISYNPEMQVMFGNWKFETLDGEGNVTATRIRPLQMRQTYRTEMEYLVELSGFTVVDVYADYRKTPAANGNFIWVLRRT